jgi:hypothetical protein
MKSSQAHYSISARYAAKFKDVGLFSKMETPMPIEIDFRG